MDVSTLDFEQKRIDEYVKRFYPKKYKNRKPILDGINDTESYLKSKIKVCWVLKEPYDEKKGQGGGFSLRKMLNDKIKNGDQNFGNTWTPIGYISYSLIGKKFLPYEKLIELMEKDKNTVMNSLKNISYINVGKMPAKFQAKSPYKIVKEEYKIWAPILLWQLLKYDPDVIIFGNTISHFWDDLRFSDKDYRKFKNGNYIAKYGKLFLDVYHPAVRGGIISQEDYYSGIINSVKRYYENGKHE